MNNCFIYAYKEGSASAKALANALEVKRIKHKNSKFKGSLNKMVINWGSNTLPDEVLKCPILNVNPKIATNKLDAFNAMRGMSYCIPFTEDIEVAKQWIESGSKVVCRTILNGHSGNGIIIAEELDQLVNAPLYTKYIPKDKEWRVHVMNGECFFTQRKARNYAIPDGEVNWGIRNHANGFIFAHNNLEVPPNILDVAADVIDEMGLDFGAVDILTTKSGKAYVLEVNTAPGLEGTTLEKYVDAFRRNYE